MLNMKYELTGRGIIDITQKDSKKSTAYIPWPYKIQSIYNIMSVLSSHVQVFRKK